VGQAGDGHEPVQVYQEAGRPCAAGQRSAVESVAITTIDRPAYRSLSKIVCPGTCRCPAFRVNLGILFIFPIN